MNRHSGVGVDIADLKGGGAFPQPRRRLYVGHAIQNPFKRISQVTHTCQGESSRCDFVKVLPLSPSERMSSFCVDPQIFQGGGGFPEVYS